MMKRLYGCVILLGVVLGMVWYGSHCMKNYHAQVEVMVENALVMLEQKDTAAAAAVLHDRTEALPRLEQQLAFFVPRESLIELKQCLQAAGCYCEQGIREEAAAELVRAKSRLQAMAANFARYL